MAVSQRLAAQHEQWLAHTLGGRQTRGSGSQWRDQGDGKHTVGERFRFFWDGKCTRAQSLSVTVGMWRKVASQAGWNRPLLPLRWYRSDSGEVELDLVAMAPADFLELRAGAQRAALFQERLQRACEHVKACWGGGLEVLALQNVRDALWPDCGACEHPTPIHFLTPLPEFPGVSCFTPDCACPGWVPKETA